jgi:cytochrome c oxidase subunit 2
VNGALLLPQASTNASEVDALLGVLLATSVAVLALVFGLMLLYVVRYRAGNGLDRGTVAKKTWRIEIAWTAATLAIFFGLFLWGADLYLRLSLPPPDALKISVIGKQWMWKVEHPAGQHEINTLHVPVNRPIELLMTSEDVIHDFDIPAFRIKHDVLPGRYETLWFTADKIGSYHLFCSQFCGTDHAAMGGQVVVMSAGDFQAWLATTGSGETLAAAGQALFVRYGCSGCHRAEGRGGNGTVRAPSLNGLFGSPVPLADGTVVVADDRYIRDAILTPKAQVVASYAPLMPAFAGVVGEAELVKLIAYIESLAAVGETR